MLNIDMRRTVTIWAIWLVVANMFALAAQNRLNLRPDTAYKWINPNEFAPSQSWNVIDLHARWDSFWYFDIAENGYSFTALDKPSNIAFFPLYPLLLRIVGPVFGNNLALAGWVLSSLFLLGALVFFERLVREFHKNADPQRALMFLLIFPTAFFLNAAYTESLFLLLSVASIYYGRRKQYLAAGVLGGLAALTRPTGFLLFVPLAWEFVQTHGVRRVLSPRALSLLLVPVGTAAYFFYHFLRFGDFFLWWKVEKWWGRAFAVNREHLAFATPPAIVHHALDIGFVAFALVAAYFIARRLRPSYAAYILAALAIPLASGTTMSIGRFLLVLFPIPLLAATIKNETGRFSWMLVSTLLLALVTVQFAGNYWAG